MWQNNSSVGINGRKAVLKKLRLRKLKDIVSQWGSSFQITSDMKMCWTLTGQSHGGLHPCIVCPWTPTNGLLKAEVTRTPAQNRQNHERWLAVTQKRSPAAALKCVKNFNNCVRPSLVDDLYDRDTQPISELFCPPPLHLKLRNVNTLVNDLRREYSAICDEWLSVVGVATEQYHHELEGNPCSKLLRSTGDLRGLIDICKGE